MDPSVAKDLFRDRQAGAHQHRGPDNRVKARDVLANDVEIRGPPRADRLGVRAISHGAEVVDQRIDPDVDDAARVVGHRDAPGLPRAADRNILETRLEQSENLVPAHLRHEEVRVPLEMVAQLLGVFRQPEEVVLLADPLGLRPVNRAIPVDEVLLLLEGLARHAVPAFVMPLEDVAGGGHLLHELLHAGRVPRLGRPNEIVEGNVQTFPDVEELHGHAIAVRERILTELAGLPEDVLRVLVVAHQEMGLDPAEPLVTRDDVGGNLLVRRPEMRAAVHVINSRRQVET